MKIAKIIESNQGQVVRLPDEFRFKTDVVSIRREGDAVILQPIPVANWPEHFFESIHVKDPAIARPSQGA
jgi:virulence-associated protein VagC